MARILGIILTLFLMVSFSGCYTVQVPEDPEWKEWPRMPKKTQTQGTMPADK